MILVAVGYRLPLGGAGTGLSWKVMGIVMKKVALLATALAMVSGSAFAADLHVKAVKADPKTPGKIDVSYSVVAEVMNAPDVPILDVHETIQ